MTAIRVQVGQSVDLLVEDLTVRVTVDRDADGGLFVALGGVDCDLAGEEPGLYYPTRREPPAPPESPLDRICRQARERDAEILANPDRHDGQTVADAKLRAHHRTMLTPAAVLRYGD